MSPRHQPRSASSGLTAGVICLLAAVGVAAYEIKVVTGPVEMGESPYWCEETKTVSFVDIIGKQVLRYNPAYPGELQSVSFKQHPGRVSPVVPVRGTGSRRLLVGVGCALHLVDVDWGRWGAGRRHTAAVVRSDVRVAEVGQHTPHNRFNDGKADREGRLWIGTMDDRQTSRRRRSPERRAAADSNVGLGAADPTGKPDKGELYRFDLRTRQHGDRGAFVQPTRVISDDLGIPNGMAWTADNKAFYLADSAAGAIHRFDYDAEEGQLGNRSTVFEFAKHGVRGVPDGLTLDVDGNLWVACVHGGAVIRVDPRAGRLLQTVRLNVTNVSAAEWGGRNRDVLYVTSARYKMGKSQLAREPEAGCMFAITGLGTRGLPGTPYPVHARETGRNHGHHGHQGHQSHHGHQGHQSHHGHQGHQSHHGHQGHQGQKGHNKGHQ